MKMSARRGSALLIVLGMLSFVVVSAVAFATYMRYSRLPSSYLRRTSASRLLAKAALANAMETIDCAIGNNVYPGVGDKMYKSPRLSGTNERRNYWRDRVFVGAEESALPLPNETVATLNMEALAYVPPPFINELRFWSRRSTAAEWHTMAFDAGRYAFAALDVSDCFDVNRILANVPRNSSDTGRVTLAHCFENDSHTGYVVQPDKWDSFIARYSDPDDDTKVPLVSVADLNLALNADGPGNMPKPFTDYLNQGQNAKFVRTDSGPQAELLRNMTFVTDSYFPADTNNTEEVFDISLDENQPFYNFKMMSNDGDDKNDDSIDEVINKANPFKTEFASVISPAMNPQLYDYLDLDSVPLSLAAPTVERTPMITGVSLTGSSLKLAVTPREVSKEVPAANDYEKPGKVTAKIGTLNLTGHLRAMVGFAFPFKYSRGDSQPKFKAQALATVTFVKAGNEQSLRVAQKKSKAIFAEGDWKSVTSKKNEVLSFENGDVPTIVALASEMKEISVPKEILEEDQVALNDLMFDLGQVELKLEKTFDAATRVGAAFPEEKGTYSLLREVDGNGAARGEVEFKSNFKAAKSDLSGSESMDQNGDENKYIPVIQVWARVVDSRGNMVDLVPACLADDASGSAKLAQSIFSGSKNRSALKFYPKDVDAAGLPNDDTVFDYQGGDLAIAPGAYLADDPRFNYAVENLYTTDESGKIRDMWLANAKSSSASRDGDIFMATSDAGYLQSPYELMFLLDLSGQGLISKPTISALTSGYDGKARTSASSTAANSVMWRTCSSRKCREQIQDMLIVSGQKGYRVNPFSANESMLLAALANTPIDWWAASTNDAEQAKSDQLSMKLDKAMKYAFSEFSASPAPMAHGTIENGKAEKNTLAELAQKMHNRFAESNGDWEKAWDDIKWDEPYVIDDVDLGVTLHSVDKHFLYGFWRECFANRQQLFLIFLRAEPMMMGGGGLGQTPPQLGARAVALVWRDPKATTEDVGGQPRPHRMRVLFYRQLD